LKLTKGLVCESPGVTGERLGLAGAFRARLRFPQRGPQAGIRDG